MSEEQYAHDEAPETSADAVRTGVPDIDEVLESVEGLDDRPLDEHVGAFEEAHTRLRRALDSGAGESH
ncbi:MAG: hypothetical protein ACR2K3_14190 [Nocardioides sp.]